MNTEIIYLSPKGDCSDYYWIGAIERAASLIKKGETVAFPTETVYGLGADGLNEEAVAKIYRAKGRPSDNPLILHVDGMAMLEKVAVVDAVSRRLLAHFAPAPLTLVLPKKAIVPDIITGGLPTVAVRIPSNPIAGELIKRAGVPIAAPSANISGRPSPTTATMVRKNLAGKIPLILDGGECEHGLESTIVKLNDRGELVILRLGAITCEAITQALPDINIIIDRQSEEYGLAGEEKTAAVPLAPGMKYRHYAPKAPLTVIEPNEDRNALKSEFLQRINDRMAHGKTLGIIASREMLAIIRAELGSKVAKDLYFDYGSYLDLTVIASKLYQSLSYYDDFDIDEIIIEGVPNKGIGSAIMNRLLKASVG